ARRTARPAGRPGGPAEVVAAAEVGREGLAAVAGAVLRHAEDVDVLVVAGIDAHLAEVHRPRVDAVDAGPGVAAVGGPEQAARLDAVGALLLLGVLFLAAQAGAVGPPGRRAAAAPRRAADRQGDVLVLRAAEHVDGDLVAFLVLLEQAEQLLEALDRLLVHALDQVALVQAGLLGRALRQQPHQPGAALRVLADGAQDADAGKSTTPATAATAAAATTGTPAAGRGTP